MKSLSAETLFIESKLDKPVILNKNQTLRDTSVGKCLERLLKEREDLIEGVTKLAADNWWARDSFTMNLQDYIEQELDMILKGA